MDNRLEPSVTVCRNVFKSTKLELFMFTILNY